MRSRHRMCSFEKVILKNLSKFTGKHLCQSIFFNKFREIFKNIFFHGTPPCGCYCLLKLKLKFYKTIYLKNHLKWWKFGRKQQQFFFKTAFCTCSWNLWKSSVKELRFWLPKKGCIFWEFWRQSNYYITEPIEKPFAEHLCL